MQKKWHILEEPPASFFEAFPELPRPVCHLLYHRNLRTQEQIDEFLNPEYSKHVHDPFLFRDMEKAVQRIFLAMEKQERITIHGDYDADGVSGAVILLSFFKACQYEFVDVYLPHRETDGYGLNTKTIQHLHTQGTTLLITCDCGISNTPEVALAQSLGMDVIITDHHTIPALPPQAFATIHPKIDGETYPDKGLAGGGVAFKLVQGLLHTYQKNNTLLPNGETPAVFEKWQLDMAAIATVADMVPLLGESRTLTKYGLIVLRKTRRVGLLKLYLEIGLMQEDNSFKQEIDADTIGFRIAPRINAAGRMDHANVAFNLIMSDRATDAVDLAYRLNENNIERQKMTETLVFEAQQQVAQMKTPILFVLGQGWPTGLIGLISGKLKEQFQKPTIVMSRTPEGIVGSGRSISGFNFILGMQAIPQFFTKFGGHPMAGGFTLADSENSLPFQEALIQEYEKQTQGIPIVPVLDIDAEIPLSQVDWKLFDQLEQFRPFGMGNPKPKYLARELKIVRAEPLGKEGKHIRLTVSDPKNTVRKFVGWNLCIGNEPNWCRVLQPGERYDIVFELGVNEWNGNRELQLTIIELKKSE